MYNDTLNIAILKIWESQEARYSKETKDEFLNSAVTIITNLPFYEDID